MASNVCIEPGCSEPRHKTYSRCHTHLRASWKRSKQAEQAKTAKSTKSRRRERTCRLCHRTPAEAALFAARGIACTGCNAIPAPMKPAKSARIVAENARQTALLVDAERSILARAQLVVIDEQPMPGPADLRHRLIEANSAGMTIIRRHKFTGGGR